jgi:hypothetical protein
MKQLYIPYIAELNLYFTYEIYTVAYPNLLGTKRPGCCTVLPSHYSILWSNKEIATEQSLKTFLSWDPQLSDEFVISGFP